MHVLHHAQQIQSRVADCLGHARAHPLAGFHAYGVALDAVVRQLPLLGREPPRRQREIGQQEGHDDRDAEGDGAFDDEQPPPALEAVCAVKSGKCRRGDQAREGDGEDVARVQDRYSGGHLLASVEHTQQKDCGSMCVSTIVEAMVRVQKLTRSGIEGCLKHAQEESSEHKPLVVVHGGHKTRGRGPCRHTGAHVQRGSDLL